MSFGPFNPMLALSANPPTDGTERAVKTDKLPEKQEVEEADVFETLQPNNTLYLNRLNEKIPTEELRDALFTMFMKYGKIFDVLVKRNLKMRGQAFIIFHEVDDAIKAREATHKKFELFNKLLKVYFAKEQSDLVAKKEGTFVKKIRKPLSEKISEHKNKILEKRRQEYNQRLQNMHNPSTISIPPINIPYLGREKPKHSNQPNKVLFVEGLQNVDYIQLEMLFRNFIGFREMRGVRPKGIAFVEFDDELKATHCLNELNGQYFHGVQLQISYQNK